MIVKPTKTGLGGTTGQPFCSDAVSSSLLVHVLSQYSDNQVHLVQLSCEELVRAIPSFCQCVFSVYCCLELGAGSAGLDTLSADVLVSPQPVGAEQGDCHASTRVSPRYNVHNGVISLLSRFHCYQRFGGGPSARQVRQGGQQQSSIRCQQVLTADHVFSMVAQIV